jgi:hypothetical protein
MIDSSIPKRVDIGEYHLKVVLLLTSEMKGNG